VPLVLSLPNGGVGPPDGAAQDRVRPGASGGFARDPAGLPGSGASLMGRIHECGCQRQIDPACRVPVTQRDAHVIVVGRRMAVADGGSGKSRHLGQIRVGTNRHDANCVMVCTLEMDLAAYFTSNPSVRNSDWSVH